MLYELSERPWILLIGADGQLGWELRRTASPLGDVFATVENASRRRNVSRDLLDCAAIRRAFGIVLDDAAIDRDFPRIGQAGSFDPSSLDMGRAMNEALEELRGEATAVAVAEKFGIRKHRCGLS